MPSTKSKARLPPPFLSTMPHAPFSAIVLPPSLSAIVLLLSLAAFAFLLIFFQRENGERQRRNFGSANGNRTRISALKGPRANRCTIAPRVFRFSEFNVLVSFYQCFAEVRRTSRPWRNVNPWHVVPARYKHRARKHRTNYSLKHLRHSRYSRGASADAEFQRFGAIIRHWPAADQFYCSAKLGN